MTVVLVWLLGGMAFGMLVGWRIEQARWNRIYLHVLIQHPVANTTPPTTTELLGLPLRQQPLDAGVLAT